MSKDLNQTLLTCQKDYNLYLSDLSLDLHNLNYYLLDHQDSKNLGSLCSALACVDRVLSDLEGNLKQTLLAIKKELNERREDIMEGTNTLYNDLKKETNE